MRLKDYNYAQAGVYFVTICTRNRVPYMAEPPVHAIVDDTWKGIPDHAVGVTLDEWIVMPNYVHGLLVLSNRDNHAASASEGRDEKPADRIARMAVISARGNSLPVDVRIFKATVTGACRRAGYTQFAWQSGYYEHVVRNERELGLVRAYIRNNPAKWALDHDHPDYRGPQPSTTPWIDE